MSKKPSIFTIDANTKNAYKFEEALALTGFGKYNYLLTSLCGLISIAAILETMGFSFIIPAAECDLELTLTQKGWLSAIPFIGLVCASQFWGYLADTKGRRRILMISMSLGSISSMISSFSPNLTVFAIIRLISAALMAASNAIVMAYYGELTPATHADMMISVLSSVLIGSTILATGMAWGILILNFDIPIDYLGLSYKPWRLLVLCYAIPFLLASIALIKAPESPKYLMSQGKNDRALKILREMYAVNTKKDESSYPVSIIILDQQDKLVNKLEKKSPLETIWSQTVPIFKAPILKYTLILMLIAFGIYGCGNSAFLWMPDMLERFFLAIEQGPVNEMTFCETMAIRTEINLAASLNFTNVSNICDDSFKSGTYPSMIILTVIVTLCNLIVAVLLRWISKKLILIFVLGMNAFATFIIYFITNAYVSWVFVALYLCGGVLVGIIIAFAVETFPTHYRAMGVSTVLLVGRIGSIIGTNIMGLLIEKNCEIDFFIFAAVLCACTIASVFLPDKKKKKTDSTKL